MKIAFRFYQISNIYIEKRIIFLPKCILVRIAPRIGSVYTAAELSFKSLIVLSMDLTPLQALATPNGYRQVTTATTATTGPIVHSQCLQ